MRNQSRLFVAACALVAVALRLSPVLAQETIKPEKLWVYIGTYTQPNKSKGIYFFEMDLASGKLTPKGLAGEVQNPSFLAIHPTRKYLYAAGELPNFNGKPGGAISAFAIDPSNGQLKLLNQQSSGGAGPCFVAVDATGKAVLTANYGGGSVASLPVSEDGTLKPAASFIQHTGSSANPQRQKEPHAHSINLDKANRFAFAADLGLDKVLVYKFDPAAATLTPNEPASASVTPGSGPRHFAFHPSGKFAYVINELTSTVTAFTYDTGKGVLTDVQSVSSLPKDTDPRALRNSTAEVQVHPSGKFLYGSNRGHDSIAVFTIDQSTGQLTHVENEKTQGRTPRNFGIDPTGAYLIAANQNTDNLVVFKIDPNTGALDPAGVTAECFNPVCVKFIPAPR